MSSIGSGYDLSNHTYSPDGRVFQVEYANKAVENSSTAVGIKCKDGIVFGVEKLLTSKMLEKSSNKRIFTIGKSTMITCAGFLPDVTKAMKIANEEADKHKEEYGEDIPVKTLAERLGFYIHMYTLYPRYRPFGCALLIAGYDYNGYNLYSLEPNGNVIGYYGYGIGKAKTTCKNELEKINFKEITCREALLKLVSILDLCHEEWKDKDYDLDMAWCCEETGHIVKKIDKEFKKELFDQVREKKMEEDEI